jgi:hypothetical protein
VDGTVDGLSFFMLFFNKNEANQKLYKQLYNKQIKTSLDQLPQTPENTDFAVPSRPQLRLTQSFRFF